MRGSHFARNRTRGRATIGGQAPIRSYATMPTDEDLPSPAAGEANDPSAPAAPRSARTRVRRIPENGRYDAATVRAIIDAALLCHVAFAEAQGIHCIPTACWRIGDYLYIHGSNGSRMLKVLQSAKATAVAITHVDALVLARSAFNHTMNYRSVVIYGAFAVVPDSEKAACLAALMEHIAPGRQSQVRAGNASELAATTVLRIGLQEAAAKVRSGAVDDDAADLGWPVWAGELPLALTPQPPKRDAACGEPAPEHVLRWLDRTFYSR